MFIARLQKTPLDEAAIKAHYRCKRDNNIVTLYDAKLMTYKNIINKISQYYNRPITMIKAKTRKREYLVPRQLSMYFGRAITKLSYRVLAGEFNQDHATAHQSCKVIKNYIDTNDPLKKDIDKLRIELKKL